MEASGNVTDGTSAPALACTDRESHRAEEAEPRLRAGTAGHSHLMPGTKVLSGLVRAPFPRRSDGLTGERVTNGRGPEIDPALGVTLAQLGEEGWEIWAHFDREVRRHRWHSFVPAEYGRVLLALVDLWKPGLRFLEWGSATGIIAIMADLLGYEAHGIELDEELVAISVEMARRYRSAARFTTGSFLPAGYAWRPADGDGRLATVGEGVSGYLKLGHPLEDFDLVYAYPWSGEEAMMHDLMRVQGAPGAGLVIQRDSGEVVLFREGKVERSWGTGSS